VDNSKMQQQKQKRATRCHVFSQPGLLRDHGIDSFSTWNKSSINRINLGKRRPSRFLNKDIVWASTIRQSLLQVDKFFPASHSGCAACFQFWSFYNVRLHLVTRTLVTTASNGPSSASTFLHSAVSTSSPTPTTTTPKSNIK
jgi:hypothetical protein